MRQTTFILLLAALALISQPLPAQEKKNAPGLLGRASDGTRTVTFVTPTASFTLGAEQSIHPQLQSAFTVEWSGMLTVLRAGQYTIFANPGAKVLVDGKEVQNQPVQLDAGERAVQVKFQRASGPARLQLEWQSAFFRREPVPVSALSHRDEPAELAATRQAERGRELVEELNCTACHQPANKLLGGRRGPELSRVGDRATAAWIFQWLENPRHFRTNAVMPTVLTNAQDRADAAGYLASLKSPKPAAPAEGARAESGKELFGKVGCVACHGDGGFSLTGLGSKFSAGELARYLANPLAVDPSGRMPNLALSASEAESLAAHLVQSRNADFEKAPPEGNLSRGRMLVAMTGCANCHLVKDTQGEVRAHLEPPPLATLNPANGCLGDAPSAKAARYDLSAADRDALRAFVKSPDVSEAPVQDFHRTVKAFNCAACHELNRPAKISAEQMPPGLTHAGDKLRASWLQQVLLEKKRVRPWMDLRMPHFGDAVQSLTNFFAAQAGAEPGEGERVAAPSREQVDAGVKLLGTAEGGLGCINCHDFRGEKSIGALRGPDMTEMDARIRADWLRRWLWEPSRIQPGTAMPAFFQDLPAPKAEGMIASLQHALRAGRDLPLPAGLGNAVGSYVQKVGAEPVLIRTFLIGSNARAIAVGLPGGQSYCFDAQVARLRFAWTGGFLDLKPVWAGRGGAPAEMLGPKWYEAPQIFPLRIGNPEADPAKVAFKGYRLENKTPVMLYEVDGVRVAEKITAVGRGLAREFTLGEMKGEVWFLAPPVPGINVTSTAGLFTNGRLRIPGGKSVRFTINVTPQ
ncbi:MAG: c-type cytochrome [Verrucomicrobia bacterium]|nr:c-type cytochrome [Verrucomicrobiota bacterium]